MKREFLQLAHKLDLVNPKEHIGGWWYSEKLDGERCFWDGGISRGLLKSVVPYANTAKDARYVVKPVATGLWSRYGNVIHAPDWFLDSLPAIPLDGELYSNTKRQFIHSTIKKLNPVNDEWTDIQYVVFDSPPLKTVLANGVINTTNFKRKFINCDSWAVAQCVNLVYQARIESRYERVFTILQQLLPNNSVVRLHQQYVLPMPQNFALEVINRKLTKIVESGGEGLIVRDPNTTYVCGRSHKMLKVKPFDDMEGTVIGYITGRETELGSKLLGMMGSLVLSLDSGIRLELSGFTDEERVLRRLEGTQSELYAMDWAIKNPETEVPDWIEAKAFPRGTRVTFKYRGLSADGVPQEARYWRNRI